MHDTSNTLASMCLMQNDLKGFLACCFACKQGFMSAEQEILYDGKCLVPLNGLLNIAELTWK